MSFLHLSLVHSCHVVNVPVMLYVEAEINSTHSVILFVWSCEFVHLLIPSNSPPQQLDGSGELWWQEKLT